MRAAKSGIQPLFITLPQAFVAMGAAGRVVGFLFFAQREEFLNELEARFTREPVDSTWRAEKEKYEEGATVLYGTVGAFGEGAEKELQ